jgi:hypothetical protein
MNRVAERKAQRKAYRQGTAVEKAEKLEKKEAKLESALSAVRSKLAKVTHKPVEPRPSSSAQKVTIQPGKQGVIFLKALGDTAHQITFNFREPEGSGNCPRTTLLRFLCTPFSCNRSITGGVCHCNGQQYVPIPASDAWNRTSPHRHGQACFDICSPQREGSFHPYGLNYSTLSCSSNYCLQRPAVSR